MKRGITLISIFCLITGIAALAQPCTKEDKLKKSGFWTPGLAGSTSGVTAADLARQKTVINNIIQPIQKKYTPRGLDIKFGGAHMGYSRLPENVKGGNYYYAYFYLAEHPCVYTKEAMENVGSGSSFTIYVNDLGLEFGRSFFVATKPNEEDLYSDAYALIDEKPVQKDGAWYWHQGKGSKGDYRWVITYENKQPFLLISKKEFAERLKVYYQKKLKKAETDFAETLKSNEEAYQNVKKFNAQEAEKFKTQSKAQAEQMRDIEKKVYSKSMQVVENILTSTDAAALNEPAMVDHVQGFDDFKGFAKEGDLYGMWVIKPNTDYFNTQLPKSSPQFFTIHVKMAESDGDVIGKTAQDELFKALDFASLKSMLGK